MKGELMAKYDPKSSDPSEFINNEEILETIEYGRANAHNKPLIIEKKLRAYLIEKLLYSYHVMRMI